MQNPAFLPFIYVLLISERLSKVIHTKYRNQYQLAVEPDDIIITTGSQQALDLIGKVLIDEGDSIIMEEPGYLGAIQAFSQYQPHFCGVTLLQDGPDINQLEEVLKKGDVKFAYVVPNFQNPTGLTYSEEKRKAVLDLVRKYHCILVEDDPYGELSFSGKVNGYISKDGLEESILLGETCFPKEVSFTRPDGGMFIWATLPDGQSAKELFDRAIQKKVAFVPGEPFYTDGRISNTMRLNYTNASKEMIEEGIRRIADSFADI